MAKNIRTIQRTGLNLKNPDYDAGRVLVPNEMGLEPGDVVKFEKIDNKTVKIIKVM